MAKPIILIHGAWHAKWCWKDLAPLLIAAGHPVLALDLPGHGENEAAMKTISLQSYVEYVIHILEAFHEPVVIVGHSFAGAVLSQVAEWFPQWIDQLIYIAAFIPKNGYSVIEEAKNGLSSHMRDMVTIDLKKNMITIASKQQVSGVFYQHCSLETVQFASSQLQAEPYRPFTNTMSLTPAKFGAVKKTYIVCREDNLLTQAAQWRMCDQHHCKKVSLQADHSPFLSMPPTLAEAILNCVNDSLIV